MITSPSNANLKQILQLQTKAKARRESGLFVVEGLRLIREVPPDMLVRIYASESFLAQPQALAFAQGLPLEIVSDSAFKSICDTRTPQGILAVVRCRYFREEELLAPGRPLLVLETLQDPGNLGTIFRTAEAAGAAGILMNRETADVYQPKVVRGTMGAIFRVPFCICDDLPALMTRLHAAGYTSYAAHLSGEHFYDELSYPQRTAFLIGNEGGGLSDALTACAGVRLRIPMEGRAESLNAAVAASVLLYEAYRQRRLR